MGLHYGQAITWGPLSAPALFTGATMSYRYGDKETEQLITDGAGKNIVLALHSQQAAISFEAKVNDGSTDFLQLSEDAGAIVVSGLDTGLVLVSQAVESWRLGQAKTASIQGIHFPNIVAASPALAGTGLSAFTPDQSTLAGLIYPGGTIIYGTFGITHAAGVLHALTITQNLTIQADDPSPVGTILGAASFGYVRRISLEILAKAAKPAVGSVLSLTGAPAHAAGYRVTSSEEMFAETRGKMYQVDATWIPAMSA